MIPLLYLAYTFAAQSEMIRQLPPETPLHVRLTTAIASFSSKAGSPIAGVLVAPVRIDGRVVLPAGSTITGAVKRVTRVGYGIRHECASLTLDFNRLHIPGSAPVELHSRLTRVDNGREKVTPAGTVQGIRATSAISYRVSGYVRTALLWDIHAEMAEWAIKSLVLELPEPEIYYPAGTELVLHLTKALTLLTSPDQEKDEDQLTREETEDLRDLVRSMPARTTDPETGRPSDLTNVLLVGSRDEIAAAFQKAGWKQAGADSIRARIGCIRAAAEIHGFQGAPMTALRLNGETADMSWQKSLNDVSKRHHIRIWKQPGSWNGQELWLAAATRDVDFAYMRAGRTFTHQIDPKVDEERDKVANDLAFTSCSRTLAWTERQGMPRFTRNATGDTIATDTRVVVLQVNGCESWGQQSVSDVPAHLAARGGRFQRFLRREILVTRSDFLRTNIYYRSYEASRWLVEYVKYRKRKSLEMQVLLATYGPTGSSQPDKPRQTGRTLSSLR